jgi:hypothetical protein
MYVVGQRFQDLRGQGIALGMKKLDRSNPVLSFYFDKSFFEFLYHKSMIKDIERFRTSCQYGSAKGSGCPIKINRYTPDKVVKSDKPARYPAGTDIKSDEAVFVTRPLPKRS